MFPSESGVGKLSSYSIGTSALTTQLGNGTDQKVVLYVPIMNGLEVASDVVAHERVANASHIPNIEYIDEGQGQAGDLTMWESKESKSRPSKAE